MMDDRKVQTRHQVESGASIPQAFPALAGYFEAGCQKAATEALHRPRYDGNNYLFVVGTDQPLPAPKPRDDRRDAKRPEGHQRHHPGRS